ncbi:gluconate 2-dehydrogenase subunit 3 family protein [Phenylobacterium sp.]|uniref:gluconate 2-dehydrogenase subunit 3 family protein n=1 Tax=Phenylobacterium sp. TaxID=1871053 RepID=UPI0028A0432D|nr:gluconate 2-dehydrogenase subunit 3 family protein [Phenylobacterium sp.]
MLNRRDAFRGLALTMGMVSVGFAGPAAAALPPLNWTPAALDAEQARALDAAAELIIPRTDTPGAREAKVPQFVDRAIATYCEPAQAQLLKSGLTQMDADARAAHGVVFAALKPAQQAELLTRYEQEAIAARKAWKPRHFFSVLKEYVTIGYFTSEPGATLALNYDPVPGEYHGCIPLADVGRAWAL